MSGADRTAATNERTALQERLLNIDQQRLAIQRQQGQAILAQVNGMARLYDQSARSARAEADQHRQMVGDSRTSFGMMMPHQQARIRDLVARHQAGGTLSPEEMQTLAGQQITRQIAESQAGRAADQTGIHAELSRMLGLQGRQRALDGQSAAAGAQSQAWTQLGEQLAAQQAAALANSMRTDVMPAMMGQAATFAAQIGDAVRQLVAETVRQTVRNLNNGPVAAIQ
jgi:hypothetical protein